MPTNYDAEAVADVMGLAFLRGPGDASSPAPRSRAQEGSPKPSTGEFEGGIVIHVDGTPLRVVEADPMAHRAPPPSPVFIERAVESGLPRSALRHVARRLAGGETAKVSALEWGVVPKTTLERRENRLSPQESERTERVARLFVHARRALGTEAEAREFMTTPHPELDGRSPVDAARTDLGTRRAEGILNALEYGLAL